MLDQIISAIRERKVISILYKGHERVVEPHLVGRKTSGNVALSAWQIRGFSESNSQPPWRNYLIKDIREVKVLDEDFNGPRPGYNPNDSTMIEIFAKL